MSPSTMQSHAVEASPGPAARPTLLLGLLVPVATVVVLVATAGYPDPSLVGGLGLITVIPPLVLACAVALSVSFAITLRAVYRRALPGRTGFLVLAAHVAALLVVTHGIAALLQAEPRFSTAWYHVGFVDALIVEGHPLKNVEARFSWPGFFSGAASFVGAANLGSALPLLRFMPLALNVAYLLPVVLLARTLVPSKPARWLVVWMFVLGNWVGQDYFSPQGVAYLMMLCILAVVTLAFARPQPGPYWWPGLSGRLARVRWIAAIRASLSLDAAESTAARTPAIEVGALVFVIVAFVAMAMSHQLTPVVLVVDVTALVLLRRCSARLLPLAMVVILAGWISYGAVDFWSGHLDVLFGGGSSAGSNVGSDLSGHLKGSTDHYVVILARLGFALAVWAVAALGAFRIVWARERLPLAAVVLALAPFPILAVQSYGGEAPLRIYLYTLPFMIILGVRALIVGSGTEFSKRACALFIAGAILATPLFYIARFGNERFEQVLPGEVAAMQTMYDTVTPGSILVTLNGNAPWRYRDLASYDYRALNDPATVDEALQGLAAITSSTSQPVYVLVTKGQAAYAAESFGLTHLVSDVTQSLRNSPDYTVVYSNADATLFKHAGAS